MKSLVNYSSLLVFFTMFHKYFCIDVALEITLTEEYQHEAYVAGIGSISVFGERKLNEKKDQSLYFPTQSAAGKLVGFKLRLPTPYKLKVKEIKRFHSLRYLETSEVQGPITVLLHPDFPVALNRISNIGAVKVFPSKQKFNVSVNAIDFEKMLLVRLLGTSTNTGEYEIDTIKSKIVIMNEPDIGDLTGIAIRVQMPKYSSDFPYIIDATVTHNGKTNTFVIDSKINGPATLVKLLDKYVDNCYWTDWFDTRGKYNDICRHRNCFKYGVTKEYCNKCDGDHVHFINNGMMIRYGLFYGVISVFSFSIILNFAAIILAVLYRRFRLKKRAKRRDGKNNTKSEKIEYKTKSEKNEDKPNTV